VVIGTLLAKASSPDGDASRSCQGPATTSSVALRYALEAFADGAPAEDDRTLLVLKRQA